nr:helix-turn-helix domain-containing protein [Agrobacterium fabrum]
MTHEFLSTMLAVRRASVTDALHGLESLGFIRSERGRITIKNREMLETYAGDLYGVPEEENNRMLARFIRKYSSDSALDDLTAVASEGVR